MKSSCIQNLMPGDRIVYRSVYDYSPRIFLVKKNDGEAIRVQEGERDFYSLYVDHHPAFKRIIKKRK